MDLETQSQEIGYLGLRTDCLGLGGGVRTGLVWIFGGAGGFGGLGGLYLELEFKVEGSVNLDLDIWCEGVTGAVGRTFGLILGSAQLGVGSTGLALTFGGPCPSGDRWLA